MRKINDLQEVVEILKSGGILAHPADTCFGLAGDLMNPEALKKIQAIKGREANKPMSIILPAGGGKREVESLPLTTYHLPLHDYVVLSDYAEKVCNKLLPGAVTIVLPKGPKIPSWYFPETEWIGIRMIDDENVNRLLDAFGGPIITTSANLSGEPTCYTVEEVEKAFEKAEVKPDGILVGKITDPKLPSTVIKVIDDRIEVLREGPISILNLKF